MGSYHCPLCAQPLPPKESNAALLFLDVDGVLLGNRDSPWLWDKIWATLNQLFIKKQTDYNAGFTEFEWRVAAAHHLFKQPLENLSSLIKKVQSVRPLYIVLCSQWRNDGTLDQIIKQMFGMHPFLSSLIIGKTPPQDRERYFPPENQYSFVSIAKNSFNIRLTNRAEEIDFWRKYHQLEWADFVVLDDCDDELSEKFPNNFVKINNLLSSEDVDLALRILKNSYQFSAVPCAKLTFSLSFKELIKQQEDFQKEFVKRVFCAPAPIKKPTYRVYDPSIKHEVTDLFIKTTKNPSKSESSPRKNNNDSPNKLYSRLDLSSPPSPLICQIQQFSESSFFNFARIIAKTNFI